MSSKIQSYINSSSPGKNRLPVPKKSFKSVLGHDRNIILKPQEDILDKTNILATELKFSKQIESKNNAIRDNTIFGFSSPATVSSNSTDSHCTSNILASTNSMDSISTSSQHSADNRNNNIVSKPILPTDRSTDQFDNISTKHNGENIDGDNYEDRKNDGRDRLNGTDVRESRREAREAFLKSDLVGKRFEPKIDPPDTFKTEKDHHSYNTTSHKNDIQVNGTVQNGFSRTSKGFKEQEAYIGFANLPNQVYRKSVKKGFDFTLMLIGESGLGKSTLINSLFLTDIYNHQHLGPSLRPSKTVKVEKMCVLLKEGGVQLRLTVVDTPGFGDSVDNSNCWRPILKYIDDQFDSHLNMESKVVRHEAPDTRVHCCLYFISPNGHGLRQLDIECMKQLHEKVNIVPIIAKADTMTMEECRDFKKTILNEIEQHKIKIYEFPECEDEEEQKILKKMKDKIPFAVVGSNVVVESGGRRVRGRVYPWGTVEVENLEHNDFTALRNMLVRTHLHDLKDVTNNVHYENFRYDRLLTSIGAENNQEHSNKSPMLQLQEEKEEHREKLQRMAQEMNQMFEAKVNERKNKHNESDLELQRRKEQLLKSLQQQEQDYEEMLRLFVAERDAWEEQNRHLEAEVNSTLKKKRNLFN